MGAPLDRAMREMAGADPVYLVSVTLKVTTALIESAIKQGVDVHKA